jgi:restriction endonuclease S subunit
VKISDFCYVSDYVANGSFESLRNNVNYLDDGYAVLVRLTDFTKKWQSDFRYVSENAYKFLKHSKLYAGDLIMANVGDPGIVFIVPDLKKPMTLGPNSILIRPTSSVAHTKFIYWYFKSELGCDQITSITSATAQKKFNKTAFRALDIKLPPLAEQKRIAALLDTADRILRLRESAIAKLDELEQSVFVEMFGDLINNPNKWPVKKLGNFIEIVMGQAPHSDQCNKEGKGVVFVKAGEFGIDSPIIREWTIDPLKMAKANDILICVVGATAGKINRSRFECAIGRSVASVRSTSIELNQDYLHSFLKTKILELRNRSQGAAQAVITREMLRDIEIPLPPIAKQIEFVSFLKELRNEQNMFSISSKKMSQLQMSLQYQSFAVN